MSLVADTPRPLEDAKDTEPPSKRVKLDVDSDLPPPDVTPTKIYDVKNLLPPSITLLGRQIPEDYVFQGSEKDVGITEYISHDITSIEGIIKQRFTDFLVYEIDLEGNVVHVRALGKPEGPKLPAPPETVPEEAETVSGEWDTNVEEKLAELLSENVRVQFKQLYEEGPEPPLVSDSGWEGRSKGEAQTGDTTSALEEATEPLEADSGRGRGRNRGRDRGRGRGRGGRGGTKREDTRRVLTDPIVSKEMRTSVHQAVRNLFNGKFETETSETTGEEGSRVVIKWTHRGSGRRGRGRGGGGK